MRKPPHDIEAEQAVIASCLSSTEAYDKTFFLNPDDFWREAHSNIWRAIETLANRGEAINTITVAHELGKTTRLDSVGGFAYLSQIVTDLPTSVGCEWYAGIVQRDANYRRIISLCHELTEKAYQADYDAQGLLERAAVAFAALRDGAGPAVTSAGQEQHHAPSVPPRTAPAREPQQQPKPPRHHGAVKV